LFHTPILPSLLLWRNISKLVTKNCKVVGVNNELVLEALALNHHDFEDALQYVSAKHEACDQIVSNDKGFYVGEIAVVSSLEFVESNFSE